ncbi:MAG: SMP-30/gluconolactonase/LRE family protein [Myxococcaceae bacterium]|nr:SMP-30/gluconolactonase/LRE family protein [Myxococcaceae bacterium]
MRARLTSLGLFLATLNGCEAGVASPIAEQGADPLQPSVPAMPAPSALPPAPDVGGTPAVRGPSGAPDAASPVVMTDAGPPAVDAGVNDAGAPMLPTFSQAIDPLADAGAVTLVQSGFGFLEGPRWLADAGVLLVSDVTRGRIYRYDPKASGDPFTVFRDPSGNSNGLTVDALGRLVACEHVNRRLSWSAGSSAPTTLVDRYQGHRFNAPNDVVAARDGTIYFSDPDYNLGGAAAELSFNGVYALFPDGGLAAVVTDLPEPNGVAVSPDDSTLYVSDTSQNQWRSYARLSDGGLRLLGQFSTTQQGGSGGDGLGVDLAGNVYAATFDGVHVYRPDGGYRGRIQVPDGPTNLSFGGDDGRTLFVTTGAFGVASLYRVRLAVPGLP